MSQLNVLLVVYAFPPAGGVGVLRAASLARYLPSNDIRLDVLTTRNPSSVGQDASLLQEIPKDVTIHRTHTLDLPFGLKKRLKKIITGSRPPAASTAAATSKAGSHPLKQLIQDFLLPDPQVTWLPAVTRAARRIVRDRSIDTVIITGAPYSTFLLARRLRKHFPKLSIVLDFRDEWLSTSFDAASFSFSKSEKARKFAIKAEAEAVASATAVVAVTRAARRAIRSRYPHERDDKFQYIPNGFDATRLSLSPTSKASTGASKINIVYVGSLYASTEPATLVEALKSLPEGIKSRFLVRFIGHIEELRYRQALLELGEMVELVGYMPQRQALEALDSADYALLVTHDPLNVSAKFYDYVGSGKPILACVPSLSDARCLLEDLNAGWWAPDHDAQAIRQMFIDAVARRDSLSVSFQPDLNKIEQYERAVIARSYANFLHSLQSRRLTSPVPADVRALPDCSLLPDSNL